MMRAHQNDLEKFAAQRSFRGKGPLSVALVITQHAKTVGLPLDPEKLVTEGGGQVLGLGKGAVQAILKRHGILRVLASEGGRTSRGSLNNMRAYVAFLNGLKGKVDLDAVEPGRVVTEEFLVREIRRIKLRLPLLVVETRRPDPGARHVLGFYQFDPPGGAGKKTMRGPATSR